MTSYTVDAGNRRALVISCARPIKAAWLGDRPRLEDCTTRITGQVDERDSCSVVFLVDDVEGWHFFFQEQT
jgi:hypothetical protein